MRRDRRGDRCRDGRRLRAITEASGLAASRRNPGVWWTHNDSGGPNQVFALSDSGALLSTITLTNAENRDWEDIAVGPPSGHGGATLYVADSGDNTVIQDPTGGRGNVRIYRLPEPAVDPARRAPRHPPRPTRSP